MAEDSNLLAQVRNRIRYKHYSYRTEKAYVQWIELGRYHTGARAQLERSWDDEIGASRVPRCERAPVSQVPDRVLRRTLSFLSNP